MSRYELRKEEIKQRIDGIEKKRDNAYSRMTEFENEIDDYRTEIIQKQEKVVEFKKQGDILNSYVGFLENQLVIEALHQKSYSIENFDLFEKDRLSQILRKGEDILFDWYIIKKQEGYQFNQIQPLHEILKEDYEDFRTKQLED